jgi:4-amino-4-deoxy-L-arabinose transferase-like glycosyltransferase
MPLNLEHDWRATFAIPKRRIGETTKVHLLLLLCALWLGFGLIGHQPWKPDEAQTISVVKHILASGDQVVLHLAGQPAPQLAPLYYLSAAASATLFTPLLELHDAARLISIFWMALTLLMTGLIGRELWGQGAGRQTTLIFIGSIGLIVSAHLLVPDIAGLTGYAMAFYGLALAPRRHLRAGLLLGTGCGIAFLSRGLLPAEVIAITAILLPMVSRHWRGKTYVACLLLALLAASPWFMVWPLALWRHSPDAFHVWLTAMQPEFGRGNLWYFCRTLSWYAWPALPLAGWLLWRERRQWLVKPALPLALTFFLVLLLMLGTGTDARDIRALPLLLPLAVLGSGAIDTLRRGAASALDWFGIMMFGVLGFAIWLGWCAMMTGFPAKTAERVHKLSATYVPEFSWVAFIIGVILTMIWLAVVGKTTRSNRSIVTDWAVGITMCWGLLATLWLPWLDSIKSYRGLVSSLQTALPAHYECIASHGVGDAQRALMDYYAEIRTRSLGAAESSNCDLYLIQDERNHEKIEPGQEWKLLWQGKRPSDRRESFRLYQHLN